MPTDGASEHASRMKKRAKRSIRSKAGVDKPARKAPKQHPLEQGVEVTNAFADEMYAQMQTPDHRTAIDAAFSAVPAQMGDAALAAAKAWKRKAGRDRA